ncbi:MAG: MgtC/SapB family protein [Gammaproteobacteria bacterium]
MEVFASLALALAVGLIIGIERGFAIRDIPANSHILGVRAFVLIGLMGGVCAELSAALGGLVFGVALLVLAALLASAHYLETQRDQDLDITPLIAALVTFLLGGLVTQPGMAGVAAAGAVITAGVLNLRGFIRTGLNALTPKEVEAGLWLLLITVVALPILPDQGYGPWGALNPHRIWWMVVLIATMSFAGYFAVRVAGARRGLMLTGLLAGLVSSTALTMTFSRLARTQSRLAELLAAGILVACGTMFLRVLVEVAVVHPALLPDLLPALLVMAAIVYGAAAWHWYRQQASGSDVLPEASANPLQLRTALQFGGLLALIMLAAAGAKEWLGDAGIYLLAAVSGINDVDAITLSVANLARNGLNDVVAANAIALAAAVNTLVKGGIAVTLAGPVLLGRVLLPLLLAIVAGGVVLLLTPVLM